jgi:hypothetical protein
MEKCRSFDLDSKQNDFAEPIEEARRLDFTDIPLVDPANYNSPTKVWLSARCRALLHLGPLYATRAPVKRKPREPPPAPPPNNRRAA